MPDSHRTFTLTLKLTLKYCLMHFYQSIRTVWARSTLTIKSKDIWASAWAERVYHIHISFSVALKTLPRELVFSYPIYNEQNI